MTTLPEECQQAILYYIRRIERNKSGPAELTIPEIGEGVSDRVGFRSYGRRALARMVSRGELVRSTRAFDGRRVFSSADPPDPPEYVQEKLFDE